MLDNIIQLIERAILELKQQLQNNNLLNDSSISRYEIELEKLSIDYNNIIEIDLIKIKEVLEELPFTEEEKIVIYKFIESIKTLLLLNKEKYTTFKISSQQLRHLDILINKVKEYKQELINKQENIKEDISKRLDAYNEFLKKLKNPNNTSFITELELLENIFKDLNIPITLKKQILIDIMMYNKELFNKEMSKEKVETKVERLDLNEVKVLFNNYKYDFSTLKPKHQEFILNYSSISNMKEVFETLDRLHFPHFKLPKDSSKLTTILINCDKNTIEMIVDFSKSRHITPYDLTFLIPVLIEQKNRNIKSVNVSKNKLEETPIISGKSKDYMDNVEFLENQGFDISYVFTKCRELLVVSHERLKENFEAFNKYGFKFDQDSLGNLTHPALSCLLSNNFIEVVDQFLEICPEGFNYIKENMSRIMTYSDPLGILFYNIYASYMDTNEYGDTLYPEGPFDRNFHLRGEITRYAGSGYKNIPYRGITEENKQEKTMTIDPPIENKELFSKKIQEVKENCLELKELVENDQKLQELESYTDESNPLRYNFNGILISKLKVKRIYNILKNYNIDNLEDSLLYSILYNTIINGEDFEKIKEIVKSRSK